MLLRFAILIMVACFGTYWFSIRLQPKDREFYTNLVEESIQLRTRRALEEEPAHQKRSDVQKDIWTQNEAHHFQIQSQGSNLTIWQKKKNIEASEQLQKLNCRTPNSFTLFADEGTYAFPSHQFIAKKNCHLHQGANRIDGDQIHFDLIQETVRCSNPIGRIITNNFEFTAKTLFWEKDADLLHLIENVKITQMDDLILLAQKGTVQLDTFEPTQIILEGNVRLISSRIENKESYAMADRLIYNPKDHTLLFTADRKVLFWQENGLTLSASKVIIHEDQTVEGFGDVHCTFNLEEQNRIETFFRQYL